MVNLNAQISRCIIENRDETGYIPVEDQNAMKNEILKCVADYIESIELPEKIVQVQNIPNEHYTTGYNVCLKDCQAKLDEVVKELRK